MSDPALAPRFLGRERDLGHLAARWEEAVAGRPALVAIRAETGLGKTRLVQEFYRWLNRHADPDGYWPDELGTDGNNLRVNPVFADDRAELPEIPWLWLGLRFTRPDGRNAPTGAALQGALATLKPHLRPLLAFEHRRKLLVDVAKDVVGVFAGGIPDAAIAVWNLANHLLAERREAARGALPVAGAQQQDGRELSEELVRYLAAVLQRGQPGMRSVPVVLVLDDAQWADAYTLGFVEPLLRAALAERSRLLVIVTHWEADWNRMAAEAGALPADAPPRSVPHLVLRNRDALAGFAPYDLGELDRPCVETLIRDTLPGLTAAQVESLATRVDGNPHFLEDLLRLVVATRRRWLVDGRLDRPLTPFGAAQVEKLLTRGHHEMVRVRFSEFSEELKEALATASHQGMSFLADVACRTAAELLGLDEAQVRQLHAEAQNPHAVVATVDAGLREFRQRAMQETARAYLEEALGDRLDDIRRADLAALTRVLEDPGLCFASPLEEQFALRLLDAEAAAGGADRAARLRILLGSRLVQSLEGASLYSAAADTAEDAAGWLVQAAPAGGRLLEDVEDCWPDLIQIGFRLMRSYRLEALERFAATLLDLAWPLREGRPDSMYLWSMARLLRANVALTRNRAADALAELDAAAAAFAGWPHADEYSVIMSAIHLNRSLVRQRLGDAGGARADAAEAQRLAGESASLATACGADLSAVASAALFDATSRPPAEALPLLTGLAHALLVAQEQGAARDWYDDLTLQLGQVHLVRGHVQLALGDPAAACGDYVAAIAAGEALRGSRDSDAGQSWVCGALLANGYACRAHAAFLATRSLEQAGPDFDRAVGLFDGLLATACSMPGRRDAALTLWRRGAARHAADPSGDTLPDLRRARRLYWSLFCDDARHEGILGDLRALATLAREIAGRLHERGDGDGALLAARESGMLATAAGAIAREAGESGVADGRAAAEAALLAAAVLFGRDEIDAAVAAAREAEAAASALIERTDDPAEAAALVDLVAECLEAQGYGAFLRSDEEGMAGLTRQASALRESARSLRGEPAPE